MKTGNGFLSGTDSSNFKPILVPIWSGVVFTQYVFISFNDFKLFGCLPPFLFFLHLFITRATFAAAYSKYTEYASSESDPVSFTEYSRQLVLFFSGKITDAVSAEYPVC